jgi:hypothetical protein
MEIGLGQCFSVAMLSALHPFWRAPRPPNIETITLVPSPTHFIPGPWTVTMHPRTLLENQKARLRTLAEQIEQCPRDPQSLPLHRQLGLMLWFYQIRFIKLPLFSLLGMYVSWLEMCTDLQIQLLKMKIHLEQILFLYPGRRP